MRHKSKSVELQMTPMIDVVFQLIIFFIVASTLQEVRDDAIILPPTPNGTVIEETAPMA